MAARKQSGTTMGLRLSDDLKAKLSAVAGQNSRTLHGHIVRLLEQSIESQEQTSARLSPWAREVGYLLALLADDLARSSQTADEALTAMKVGAPKLLDGLLESFRDSLGPAEVESVENDVRDYAEGAARALATKIRKADQPRARTGRPLEDRLADESDRYAVDVQASLGRPLDELLRIQKALQIPTAKAQGDTAKTGRRTRGKE